MEIPEIEGTSDEEDDPEIERPPEIVPEKLPPPLPLGPGPSATREGFGQNATGEVTMTDVRRGSDGVLRLRNLAMIENIRRAEDPAWRERLEQQQVLARLGRMFGRAEGSAPGAAGPCRRAQRRVAPHASAATTFQEPRRPWWLRGRRAGSEPRAAMSAAIVGAPANASSHSTGAQPDGTMVRWTLS
jgi:hypothetical protein